MMIFSERELWFAGVVGIMALMLIVLLALTSPASAVPTAGAVTDITSNNATIAISGASGTTYVEYGQYSGYYPWRGDNSTAPSSITIWGAPLLGGTKYYARACDDTGCGNEVSFTMSAITPVPTRGFDASFNSMVTSHWNIATIPTFLIAAYTTNIPVTVFFAIIMGSIVVGFWRKTKSVRLISIIMMILSPLIMSPTVGLMMGMPLVMQSLGAVLFAAGIAGVVLSFVKK